MEYGRRHNYENNEDYEFRYNHEKPGYQEGSIDYHRGSQDYNKSSMRSSYSSRRESGNLVAVYKGGKRSPSGPAHEDMNQQNSKYSESTLQRMDSIQDPGKRYILNEIIGSGVCGTVYAAVDTQAGNRPVAVKVQSLTSDTQELIVEEYRTFRDYGGHPNIPDFHGIYRKRSGKKNEPDQIWIVMEDKLAKRMKNDDRSSTEPARVKIGDQMVPFMAWSFYIADSFNRYIHSANSYNDLRTDQVRP